MLHLWVGISHDCYEETFSAARAGHVLNDPPSSGSLICQQGWSLLQPSRDLPLLHVTCLPPTRGSYIGVCVCVRACVRVYLTHSLVSMGISIPCHATPTNQTILCTIQSLLTAKLLKSCQSNFATFVPLCPLMGIVSVTEWSGLLTTL